MKRRRFLGLLGLAPIAPLFAKEVLSEPEAVPNGVTFSWTPPDSIELRYGVIYSETEPAAPLRYYRRENGEWVEMHVCDICQQGHCSLNAEAHVTREWGG